MELQKISSLIIDRVSLLAQGRKELKTRAERRAQTTALYEKELAKTIIKLRNGEEMLLDNEVVRDVPITVLEKISKGICWENKIKMDEADMFYKNASVGLNSLMSEVNALQSLLKYQEEV